MQKPRIDAPLAVVYAAQAATAALMWSAFSHVKGVPSYADSGLLVAISAFGLALCGTAGNALVVDGLMTLELTRGKWWFLATIATVSFTCMMFVLPVHLYVAYPGHDPEMTILAALGSWSWLWFVAVLAMAELQAPALMVVSSLRFLQAQEVERARLQADKQVDSAISATGKTTKDKILFFLRSSDGETTKAISMSTGVGLATVAKHAADLQESGIIHGLKSPAGTRWWLGAAAPNGDLFGHDGGQR